MRTLVRPLTAREMQLRILPRFPGIRVTRIP